MEKPSIAPIYRLLYLPNANIVGEFTSRQAAQQHIIFYLSDSFYDREYLFEVIEVSNV